MSMSMSMLISVQSQVVNFTPSLEPDEQNSNPKLLIIHSTPTHQQHQHKNSSEMTLADLKFSKKGKNNERAQLNIQPSKNKVKPTKPKQISNGNPTIIAHKN